MKKSKLLPNKDLLDNRKESVNIKDIKMRKSSFAFIPVSLSFFSGSASAYPIDCAILLCLAGGFPPNTHCIAAKAEMIRRVTPFPVEPPLQLWRCPMANAGTESLFKRVTELQHNHLPERIPLTVSKNISQAIPALYSTSQYTTHPWGVQSGPIHQLWTVALSYPSEITGYLSSLRVRHLDFFQRETDSGECTRNGYARLGTYSQDGSFSWKSEALPISNPDACLTYNVRKVTIEWRAFDGELGFEEVNY